MSITKWASKQFLSSLLSKGLNSQPWGFDTTSSVDPNAGTSASGQWFWIPHQEVGDQNEQSSNSNGSNSNVESVNLTCDVGKVAKNVSTSGVCWQCSASLSSIKAVESLKKRAETWKVAHIRFHYQIESINLIRYLWTCYDCHECIFEWSEKWWRLSVASVDTETTKIAFLQCSCTLSPRLFGPGTNRCKCATLKQPLPLKSSWHWNYDACETAEIQNSENSVSPIWQINSMCLPQALTAELYLHTCPFSFRREDLNWKRTESMSWANLKGAAIPVEPEAKDCRRYINNLDG